MQTTSTPTSTKRATLWRRAKKTAKVAGWAFVIVLAVPTLLYFKPQLVGSDVAYVVLSGSMEPLYSPGDVVFVRSVDTPTLAVGDIITFRVSPDTLVTHRIIEVRASADGTPAFRTQGDANDDPDPFLVTSKMVVGEVEGSMPWWGLLMTQLRTRTGTLLFVMLPCAIILAKEFVNLYKLLAAASAKTTKKNAEAAR